MRRPETRLGEIQRVPLKVLTVDFGHGREVIALRRNWTLVISIVAAL